jgi:hypothetical protein
VRGWFGGRKQAVVEFFGGITRAVFGRLDAARESAAAWLTARAAQFRAFAQEMYVRGMELGTRAAQAVQRGVAAITAGVLGQVTGVADGIVSLAERIPIPDVPLLGRVRDAVLGAARSMAGVVRSAAARVQAFVDAVVQAALARLLDLARRVGAFILRAIDALVSVVTRLIAWINRQLAAVSRRIQAAIRSLGDRVNGALGRAENRAVGEIDRAERVALAQVVKTRAAGRESIGQIIEFCYERGDYPGEPTVVPQMEIVDGTSSTPVFEGAARRALSMATGEARRGNAEIVRWFDERTASLVSLALGAAGDFLAGIWAQLRRGVDQVVARVSEMVQQAIRFVSEQVARLTRVVNTLIDRVASALRAVASAVEEIVRHPVDSLTSAARSLADGAAALLRGIVSRLVSLFSSGGSGSAGATATASFAFAGTLPLATGTATALAPAIPAILGVLELIADGIAAVVAVVTSPAWLEALMWIAIILIIVLLVILIIYGLYLLYQYLTRAKPVPRAVPRVRPRVKPRVRRRPRTPLWWNAGLSYGVVIGSGGIPGTLDTTARLPRRAPLHAHHSWPKYVGGPVVQPLMSIRDTVHLAVVHPGLHVPMAAAAAAMGYTLLWNRTLNAPFIGHLRANIGDRAVFMASMSAFYVGLNAITSPPIPPPAYGVGLASSFPRI